VSEPRSRQQGFSIMEALVAIALIAGAFLPLLVLQGQLTRTSLAIERAEDVLRIEANALDYLRALNPGLRPTGQEDLGGGVRLTWQAQALTQPKPAISHSAEMGRFDVALYDLTAIMNWPDGRESRFTIRSLGWVAKQPTTLLQ